MPETPSEDPARDVREHHWTRVIGATASPLKLFALAVLICTTVFACAAAVLGDPTTFMYCIHMFLGIVGTFSIIALWCPASLYHPRELKDVPTALLPKGNRVGPTVFMLAAIMLYAVYQYTTDKKPILIPAKYKAYEQPPPKSIVTPP